MILILEDNAERLERFDAVLRGLPVQWPVRVWRDAHAMIREAGPLLPQTVLISLDHDLEPEPGQPDPGDGYLVAQWLTSYPRYSHIVVHTSNGPRAEWMAGAFELADWPCHRVAPLGDDWIETDWRQTIRALLRQPRP